MTFGGVLWAANLTGGFHLESLSQLSFFFQAGLAVLAGVVLGGNIHSEVSGGLEGPDGHCHELVGVGGGVGVGVVGPVGLGFGVIFLGFTAMLFGHERSGGHLDL